jgi:hypothetical protein
MSFAQRIAEDMGIPDLVFWTTSACGFMGYHPHFVELVTRGYVPLKGMSFTGSGLLQIFYFCFAPNYTQIFVLSSRHR